ncbi:tRNA pseudouridine(55) synthase TruB [Xanthovirga aplysinae]|uniref:tRNA pseudouridine(55) synthase TruB n=1 Tax=Xanthovirga aplysinae TaxID=2529853 RepID=UPI0012BD7027|nr:tRNA pseudouridine(55) synthase TruB [Xanthovirga aplysinae]MTI32468.1 tRNA pseudouridine(55) synthase TruB [Xanthovirga aplysinae]
MKEKAYNFQEGEVLLIDKPYTWTSFDVVKKIRNNIKIKKVGHAGTLDPLATGLLILCTGKMTKQIDNFQAQEKEYTGKMIIGKTTPSVDLETEVDSEKDISHLKVEDLQNQISQFQGVIQQIPPIYSAVKVNGKRVYKHARKGEVVEIDPREVNIKLFELTDISLPEVSFRVICSKGTYIRSLVRDFGEALGTGAYLSELRRTRIGNFTIDQALNLEGFIQSIQSSKSTYENIPQY